MSRQVLEVEHLLRQLVAEHQKLLKHVEAHEQAMRQMDLRAMDESAKLQEAARTRIAAMETRRRGLVQQIAKAARVAGEMNVQKLSEMFPQNAKSLLKLRDELKAVAGQIAGKTYIASRLAGAVLGHLNTAVRLLAGATERTGVYTKTGTPKVSERIGVMNAVG
jgi:hypothetical protein